MQHSMESDILPVNQGLAQGFPVHELDLGTHGDALGQTGYAHVGKFGLHHVLDVRGRGLRVQGRAQSEDKFLDPPAAEVVA